MAHFIFDAAMEGLRFHAVARDGAGICQRLTDGIQHKSRKRVRRTRVSVKRPKNKLADQKPRRQQKPTKAQATVLARLSEGREIHQHGEWTAQLHPYVRDGSGSSVPKRTLQVLVANGWVRLAGPEDRLMIAAQIREQNRNLASQIIRALQQEDYRRAHFLMASLGMQELIEWSRLKQPHVQVFVITARGLTVIGVAAKSYVQ